MENEEEKSKSAGDSEQGILDHEASIWEVLRKSEEKIRVEKKRLAEERLKIDKIREDLFREKDELAKIKDEVLAQKNETLKEREQLSSLKDELAAKKQKASEVVGRLEEQRGVLKEKVHEVNLKVKEVSEREKALLQRERDLLKANQEISSKREELLRREEEITVKEQELSKKSKIINEHENELTDKSKSQNEREMALNQKEERILSKEKEITQREEKLQDREKRGQETYEDLLSLKASLNARERKLTQEEKRTAASEGMAPIKPLAAELEGPEPRELVKELDVKDVKIPAEKVSKGEQEPIEPEVRAEQKEMPGEEGKGDEIKTHTGIVKVEPKKEALEPKKSLKPIAVFKAHEQKPKRMDAEISSTPQKQQPIAEKVEKPKEPEAKVEEPIKDSEKPDIKIEEPDKTEVQETTSGLEEPLANRAKESVKAKEHVSEEEEEKLLDDERECPTCGTLISKAASVCFACGTDIQPADEKAETEPDIKPQESSKEIPVLEPAPELDLTKTEEPKDEVILPSKDELYTLNDDQLIRLCNSLNLDSSGRSKHLRERLLDYIESQEKDEKEKPSKKAGTRQCPDCNGDLTFVAQYDAWYCESCEKYAPTSEE